ncbi:MAG: hypothetical protein MHM6MM_003386 [Cercozoa sp. M6MM]
MQSSSEVESILDGKYKKKEKLGEGTYGVVYKARDMRVQSPNEPGYYVALKKVRIDASDDGMPSTTLREISSLKLLSRHPNIVKLIEVINNGRDGLYLVFEFLDRDLKHYLDKLNRNLPALNLQSFMYQLLDGLAFCHEHSLLHRDLKPQNLLIDRRGTLKLADFGLARQCVIPCPTYTHEVVTLWYRAPEILLGGTRYAAPMDVWSVGCIFAEMVTRGAVFPGDSEINQLYKIFQVLGTPTEETWPGVSSLPDWKPHFPSWRRRSLREAVPELQQLDDDGLDLLQRMLTFDPARRITARDALEHPWFATLREWRKSQANGE